MLSIENFGVLTLRLSDYSGVDDVLRVVGRKLRPRRRSAFLRTESAYGRVAAADIIAPVDRPESDISHMDGFAAIAEDLEEATQANPVSLKVCGDVKLGEVSRQRVRHGEAARIATGASIPLGADTVIPVEEAEQRGARIFVKSATRSGMHVYRKGGDVKKGEVLLPAGRRARAQDLGLLIGIGVNKVNVWDRPKVSLIATGSELTNAARPKEGKVRESHSPVFMRLAVEQGCEALDLGIAADEPVELAKVMRRAIATSDLVLTLGGTSIGRHDLVGGVVKSLRPESFFHGIKLDRGRVTGVAVVRGVPILMLPGPIQAAMNAFLTLGVPMIRTLSGRKDRPWEIQCTLTRDWESREAYSEFRKVIYVRLDGGGRTSATPLAAETESARLLTEADGFVVVPEEVVGLRKGNKVSVTLLPGFSFP